MKRQLGLKKITSKLVGSYVRKIKGHPQYSKEENILKYVVSKCFDNRNLENIRIKLVLINVLFSTRILATNKFSKHVKELKIDKLIKEGNPEIVNRIAKFKKRKFISFASKYCSAHYPRLYPRYDRIVVKLLVAYRRKDRFASFRTEDLKNYKKFRCVIDKFMKHYSIRHFSYLELDRFLWLYGSSMFGWNTK